MRLRIAHCSMIYKKALKLSGKAQRQSTIGKNAKKSNFSITRHAQGDPNKKLQFEMPYLHKYVS